MQYHLIKCRSHNVRMACEPTSFKMKHLAVASSPSPWLLLFWLYPLCGRMTRMAVRIWQSCPRPPPVWATFNRRWELMLPMWSSSSSWPSPPFRRWAAQQRPPRLLHPCPAAAAAASPRLYRRACRSCRPGHRPPGPARRRSSPRPGAPAAASVPRGPASS